MITVTHVNDTSHELIEAKKGTTIAVSKNPDSDGFYASTRILSVDFEQLQGWERISFYMPDLQRFRVSVTKEKLIEQLTGLFGNKMTVDWKN